MQAKEDAGLLEEDKIEALEGTEGSADKEEQFTEEQISAKMQELLPDTIEDIRTFADSYDAPQAVEAVFKWDVKDIFYNYFLLVLNLLFAFFC